MHPKDADGIAKSVDPDQISRSSLIWVCIVCPDLSARKLFYGTLVGSIYGKTTLCKLKENYSNCFECLIKYLQYALMKFTDERMDRS